MKNVLLAHVDGMPHVHPEDITIILVGAIICAVLFWYVNRQKES